MLRRAAATAARFSRPTTQRTLTPNLLPRRDINRLFWSRHRTGQRQVLPVYFPPPSRQPRWKRWRGIIGRATFKISFVCFCLILVEWFLVIPIFIVKEEFDELVQEVLEEYDEDELEDDGEDEDISDEDLGCGFVYGPGAMDNVGPMYAVRGEDDGNEGPVGHEDDEDEEEDDDDVDDEDEDDEMDEDDEDDEGDEDDKEEDGDEQDENGKKDDDDESQIDKLKKPANWIFLPFPFVTYQYEQPPYTSKDPEWAQIMRIARHETLQRSLVEYLAKMVEVHEVPKFSKALGGPDIHVYFAGKAIGFPRRPPAVILLPGLAISTNEVVKAYRVISQQTCNTLESAIYPQAVAKSAWAFCSVFAKQTARDIGRRLGIGRTDPPPPPPVNPLLGEKVISFIAMRYGHSVPSLAPKLRRLRSNPRLQAPLDSALVTFFHRWSRPVPMPRGAYAVITMDVRLSGTKADLDMKVKGIFDFRTASYTLIFLDRQKLVHYKEQNSPRNLQDTRWKRLVKPGSSQGPRSQSWPSGK